MGFSAPPLATLQLHEHAGDRHVHEHDVVVDSDHHRDAAIAGRRIKKEELAYQALSLLHMSFLRLVLLLIFLFIGSSGIALAVGRHTFCPRLDLLSEPG